MSTNIGPSKHVTASIHDDGVVFLHTVDGRLFASNQIGARIWQALERRLPVDNIAADLSDRYRIPHETASVDITRFLVELERQRLLERSIGQ